MPAWIYSIADVVDVKFGNVLQYRPSLKEKDKRMRLMW